MGSENPRGKAARCGEAGGRGRGAETIWDLFRARQLHQRVTGHRRDHYPQFTDEETESRQLSEPLEIVPPVQVPAGPLLGSDEGRRASLGKPGLHGTSSRQGRAAGTQGGLGVLQGAQSPLCLPKALLVVQVEWPVGGDGSSSQTHWGQSGAIATSHACCPVPSSCCFGWPGAAREDAFCPHRRAPAPCLPSPPHGRLCARGSLTVSSTLTPPTALHKEQVITPARRGYVTYPRPPRTQSMTEWKREPRAGSSHSLNYWSPSSGILATPHSIASCCGKHPGLFGLVLSFEHEFARVSVSHASRRPLGIKQ